MTKKNCLVYETLGNINEMKVKESINNGSEIRLSGVFGVCGIKNGNNRIYSKDNYGQMVESLQKTIMSEGCLGELEHPNSMNIDLNNVSHKIESVEMHEDGTVTGTIVLLDTDKGRNAKAIVEAGVPLYISSRALGSIDESGNVTLTMLKTYDLVGTPGFSQASLHLSENQKFESLNESMCVIYEGDSVDMNSDTADDKDKEEKDNKNKDNDPTMTDLKEAIDKLSEKVESLEAQLHVAKESLEEKDTLLNDLKEQLDGVSTVNYSAIQNWITEEFSPSFKQEVSTEVTETIANGTQKWISEEFAGKIQEWITEQYSPELEKWVNEEFAGSLQDWVTEELAPNFQTWITEHYSAEIDKWVNEQLTSSIDEKINVMENKINTNVSEFLESKNNDKLDSIDKMLEALESNDKVEDNIKMLKEAQEKSLGKYAGVYAIKNMPDQYRPMFEGLSEEKKDQIALQSRAYNFTMPNVMENFWANIDFNENPVNENVNATQNIQESYADMVARQMMAYRRAI